MIADIELPIYVKQIGIIPWISESVTSSLFCSGSYHFSVKTGDVRELYPDLELNLPFSDGCIIGSGCAENRELALTKAIFEAFERLAATIYSTKNLTIMAGDSQVPSTLNINKLPVLHCLSQKFNRWVPIHDGLTRDIRWVEGINLVDSELVMLPLVMVHIYTKAWEAEQFHAQNTSGLAAHISLEKAISSGIFELVERDAAESIWLTKSGIQRIIIDSNDSKLIEKYELDDRLLCVEQRYYKATTDIGIPTVYAVRLLSPPIGNDTIITCASAATYEEALIKARQEAFARQISNLYQSGGTLYSRYLDKPGFPVDNPQPTIEDISFLDTHPDGPIKLSELVNSVPKAATGRWTVKHLIDCFSHEHPQIIVSNLTTTELEHIGAHVVRVVIPSLLPISPSPIYKYIHHPRLKKVATHFKNYGFNTSDINTEFHPYF